MAIYLSYKNSDRQDQDASSGNLANDFTGELEGEADFLAHSSDSESVDDRDKQVNPSGSEEEEDGTDDHDHQTRKPLSNPIKKTEKLLQAIRTLTLFQEQEDARHFVTHTSPKNKCRRGQNPYSDCCHFSNQIESGETAKGDEFGPFLNCPLKHSRSHDFDKFPIERSSTMRDRDKHGRPLSGLATLAWRPQSAQKKFESLSNCRNCTQTSIFLNPDLWLEDYKKKVTYAKIPQSHKDRLRDRLGVWIDNDEMEDLSRVRPLSASQLNSARRIAIANQKKWNHNDPTQIQLDPALRRGKVLLFDDDNNEGPTVKYGPSAILSLGGFPTSTTTRKPTIQHQHHEKEKEVKPIQFQMQNLNLNHQFPLKSDNNYCILENGLRVAWPSDNVRYYDDDTDPRITELLANAPFRPPTSEQEKRNQNHKQVIMNKKSSSSSSAPVADKKSASSSSSSAPAADAQAQPHQTQNQTPLNSKPQPPKYTTTATTPNSNELQKPPLPMQRQNQKPSSYMSARSTAMANAPTSKKLVGGDTATDTLAKTPQPPKGTSTKSQQSAQGSAPTPKESAEGDSINSNSNGQAQLKFNKAVKNMRTSTNTEETQTKPPIGLGQSSSARSVRQGPNGPNPAALSKSQSQSQPTSARKKLSRVKKSKTKPIRKFDQCISTVSLPVPRSKYRANFGGL